MTALRVRAPAKINLTLEVLGKRQDGYHEVRTILQTIDFCDTITLRDTDGISLTLIGESGSLANLLVEQNLAYRAAARLQRELPGRRRGVSIELEKHIPVEAGLGGGSSDAAATLRGLRVLWELGISDEDLTSIAAELGSDVPFFLRGGTALASGRGEQVAPLPDVGQQHIVLGWRKGEASTNKTARMYAALRPEHYTDGSRTERLAERIRQGQPVRDEDIYSAFEAVVSEIDASGAGIFRLEQELGGKAHLCGSGPALFFLLARDRPADELRRSLEELGMRTEETQTLSAPESLAIEIAR